MVDYLNDGEMPDDIEIQTADDGKFHVPSQWSNNDESKIQLRLNTGLVFDYYREDKHIARIDFTDITINEDDLKDYKKDYFIAMIERNAKRIAHSQLFPEGLQEGDLEVHGTLTHIIDKYDLRNM